MKYPEYCVIKGNVKKDLVVIEENSLLVRKLTNFKVENPDFPGYSLAWMAENGGIKW